MARKNKPQVRMIRVGDLVIDRRVQRAPIKTRVNRIADNFNPDAVGVIIVSLRRDGSYVVIDGQHRVAAMVKLGMEKMTVRCLVFSDLELANEAWHFCRANDTRRIGPYDDFVKGVLSNDEECVKIKEILDGFRLKVGQSAKNGNVVCITTLRSIYRSSPDLLENVIDIANTSWGKRSAAVEGSVLRGIAVFLKKHGEKADEGVLIKKLSKYGGGPSGLLGRARALKELRNGSIPALIASIITEAYNKGKRSGALPSI